MAGLLNSPKKNMAKACKLSAVAAEKGASLVLFPEGCLNGNAFTRSRQDSIPADPASFAKLQKISDKTGITICIGFTAPLEDKFNNAFAIIRPDRKILFQYKCARSSQEPEFLSAFKDAKRTVFEVDGVRTVISICCEYGLERIEESIKDASPKLILHPSAGCLRKDQVASGRSESQAARSFRKECRSGVERSAEEVRRRGIPKICANPIGFDGETFWPGNSFAVDGKGNIILWIPGENRPGQMKDSIELRIIPI